MVVPPAPPPAPTVAPRLVVLVVIDQLPAWGLAARRGAYRRGLARLLDGGVHFARAEYPYAITFTAPVPSLAPAEASLSSLRCGRCHAAQVQQWQGSIHAAAGSPGLLAQTGRMDGAAAESCLRCHAPLAEQQDRVRPAQRGGDPADRSYAANPGFDPALQREGLTCAACHLRSWTRLGPRGLAASLLSAPGYPRRELPIYERADLCLPCHQLPPRVAVAGRPLLDTYREWLLGPYMPRGIQCQHCHMPNREHTWKGVHDPATFRQGIAVVAVAARTAGGVTARARVTNVGAGRDAGVLTLDEPAAAELDRATDAPLDPSAGDGRAAIVEELDAQPRGGGFVEREDTRIPPGASLELAQGWRGDAVARAAVARITVRVRPDDYYEGLYRQRLAGRLDAATRAMFEVALARAEASPYVAYQEDVAINTAAPPPSPPPAAPPRAASPPSR